MATLSATLKLEAVAGQIASDSIALEVTDALTVISPSITPSLITATTTGGDNIIVPNVNSAKYVYIKHTGLNSAGSSSGADKVKVETADNTPIMELKSGEFAFFPYFAQGSCKLQLETDANTVQVEYAYFTRA